ncbi:hypothetical protein FQN60_013747 [Etheostoma spectabile]|uniref:Uncharacterized protein n=1 Tax=Etheostoma spectabile TaxID=54343 RepID=A0A5J5CJC8_9PERO|nr:hypothetical protein FQN60_013747 [Etheostoma spectabile]
MGMLTLGRPGCSSILVAAGIQRRKVIKGRVLLKEKHAFSNRGEENKVSWRREERNTHQRKVSSTDSSFRSPVYKPIRSEAACEEGWALESAGWTKIITLNEVETTGRDKKDRNSTDSSE